MASKSTSSGLGLVGLAGLIAAVFLASVATQHLALILQVDVGQETSLPVTGIWVIVLLVGLNAFVGWARSGRSLLSRAQLVCVTGAVLMAAPLLTQGFWHRYVGTVTSYPREGQFQVIDALPDKLWPHGANLLADGLSASTTRVVTQEQPCELKVPVSADGDYGAVVAKPYLISALVRADTLPPASVLTCTVVGDNDVALQAFSLDRPSKPDKVRNDGFQRIGVYGLRIPDATTSVTVRFSLTGPGSVDLRDAKLMSVAAVEIALRGARPVTAEVQAAMPAGQRGTTVVAPVHLLSPSGAAFVATGGVPWSEWIVCLLAWGSFLGLMMGAVLGITLLLHRHWIEAERLPLPQAKAISMLLGLESNTIWRNGWMWAGFGVAVLWCQMRYWSGHYPALPDPSLNVPLRPLFGEMITAWGPMWDVTFTLSALFLGLALFMELNILASLVFGFFCYRALFWFGEGTGIGVSAPGFPWRHDLTVGAYAAYFVIIMLMARRHLASSAKRAFLPGGWQRQAGEPVAPRVSLALLVGCCAGAGLWCWWIGVGALGFAALFAAFVIIAVVAARLRAECGVVYGYFTPYSMTIVLGSLGGIPLFGPQVVLFGLLAGMWMASTTMHLPGSQVDFTELGRREGLSQRALIGIPMFALILAIALGGWAFLTLSYGQGGDNVRFNWAYDTKGWYFHGFNQEVSSLGSTTGGSVFSPWGISLGAGATVVVSVLRQVIAGCWFHPVGILFGSTYMMDSVWGSCLVALGIRFFVVRFAGAEAVRERLIPAALGIFLASCLTYLIALIHGTVLLQGAGFTTLIQGVP